MATLDQRLGRLGGVCAWCAAVTFAARAILVWRAGLPPSDGSALLTWVSANVVAIEWAVELMFFAMMFAVPALVVLLARVARTHPAHAVVAASGWGVTIVLFAFALVVEGRLVFPVLGITLRAPEVAEVLVALDYGALHAARLVEVGAALPLALATWTLPRGRVVAAGALVLAVAQVPAAYPEAIGVDALLACDLVLAAWLVAVGHWSFAGRLP